MHRSLRSLFVMSATGLLSLSLGPACATLGSGLNSVETGAAKTFISDDQESQLGLQVKSDLDNKQKVIYLDDATVVNYVRGVADKVLSFATKERPAVKWQVNVIDDPKTVNAFATPGGYLYVYTGLLLLADNEAQLAGIMGHESGHVVARHSARQMVDQFGLESVASLALGQNPGLLGQLTAGIAEKGTMLSRSRSDEDEADEYGAKYASAAGYDPHGLNTFFEKLKAKMGDTSGITTWLSDHPATIDRMSHINSYIDQNKLGGSDLGADRYAPIKQKLSTHVTPAKQSAPPGGGGAPPSGGGAPPN